MSDYSEAELRLIESRKQSTGGGQSPSSVDQLSTPRIDRKPQAQDVNLPGMVKDVNAAAAQQQATAPTVFDTLDKDMPWLKWVGGALGVAYGINKLFGGEENVVPSNRPPSPKDRSLTRTEPTFGAETTQSSMTAGEPKIVADPVPVAPKPVTDVVTVPPAPETTANVVPTATQPQNVPVPTPSEPQPQMKYGETKINAPTGVPSPVAPPAEVAPAPVEPKPLSKLEELKIKKAEFDLQAAQNKEARAAEAHAARLAADAKRAEEKIQKSQGQSISAGDAALVKQGAKNTIINAADAGVKALAKTAPPAAESKSLAEPIKGTNVAVASQLPPETPPSTTVVPESAAPSTAPKEGVAPPKWRGGSEGSALQLFGATKKTLEPKHMAGLEVFKDFVGGELAPSTGGTIKEFPQFTEFFKKHTGETLSPNDEGKYPRLTENQVSKLHSGIRSELEDAVKGGKLKTLGKGAMAAAALLGLTGAVQAAQKGDFGPLEEAGFSGLLAKAVGGTAATLLTPGEAAAPTIGFTKQEQQTREVAQRPGVRAYAEILKNRLSGEEFNKAMSEFAATNPKRGDYAAMQELFRQQAESKKAKK